MKIHLIAAARPNFMKIAPLYHALKKTTWAEPIIVHTGQHYDQNMSDSFFKNLGLPDPDFNLEIGSGTHAQQTAAVMLAYEKLLQTSKPDLVVVVGDVNSTMACSLVTSKLGVMTAHLEAGLRSYDRSMPEELNRLVTDQLCDYLWTPSPDADQNLLNEGIPKERIHLVGNIMIDAFVLLKDKITSCNYTSQIDLQKNNFILVTLHRPANVDTPEKLEQLCEQLIHASKLLPIIFPVHPRTLKSLTDFNLLSTFEQIPDIRLLEPLNYINFMNLVTNARLLVTDSGGIQEETTYLNIPCLTIRDNTERPITITHGSNTLCKANELLPQIKAILAKPQSLRPPIPLWDGKSAQRVVESINRRFL